MNIFKGWLAFIILNLAVGSCSTPAKRKLPSHRVTFLNGSSNNKLEVLDWGGTGRPILFLAGLGNTAHVFDDFAPRFTDAFHVYGLTRRGFGSSIQTSEGYDTKTLSSDILAIIDSLDLNKVILIGHSIAGNEISKFASSYPGRSEKVVYLDAAYDYASPGFGILIANEPQPPKATTEDSSSLEHLRNYFQKVMGISFPEDEWKQSFVFSKEGKYLKNLTPDSIPGAIIKGVEHPDYINITCPALAIYAVQTSAKKMIFFYEKLDSLEKMRSDTLVYSFRSFSNEEQARFKREVPDGTVKLLIDAKHAVFISNPVETEKMIREFLK